jgi:hypothetical protein
LPFERKPRDRLARAAEDILAVGRAKDAGGNAADAAESDHRHA